MTAFKLGVVLAHVLFVQTKAFHFEKQGIFDRHTGKSASDILAANVVFQELGFFLCPEERQQKLAITITCFWKNIPIVFARVLLSHCF